MCFKIDLSSFRFEFVNDVTVKQNGRTGKIEMRGTAKTSEKQIRASRVSREGQEYEHIKQRNSSLAQVSEAANIVRQQVIKIFSFRK